MIKSGNPLTVEDCLDFRGDPADLCRGPIEYRFAMSSTGVSFPRCDKHFDRALKDYERVNETYGVNSDVAPSWIDEAEIGERWEDD